MNAMGQGKAFWGRAVLWVGLAAVIVKTLMSRLIDPDLWWHLAHGRVMIEQHVFPKTDLFSHSLHGTPWINFEWLSQIALYALYRLAGPDGLFYVKLALCLAIVAVLAETVRKCGAHGIGFLTSVAAGFWILRPRLYERVELATLFFMSVFVLLLATARNHPPARIRKIPWILLALMLLWCNMHGGFIFGVALVLLIHLGARWSGESPEYVDMTLLAAMLVLMATLINPYGPRLYLVLFEHLTQLGQGPSLIAEWAPPSVTAMPVFWALFLMSSLCLVGGLLARRPEAQFWGPAALVFSVWAGVSQRNVAIAVFCLLPFVVDSIAKWEKFHPLRSSLGARWLAGLTVAFMVVSQRGTLLRPFPHDKIQWSRVPAGACRFLDEQNLHGTLFNSYEFGGYIEWALNGRWPVLMDGRYLFHPFLVEQAELNRQLLTDPSGRGWADYWEKYHIDIAVANFGDFAIPADPTKTPFPLSPLNGMFPRSDWALVYFDHTALVFLKRVPALAGPIKRLEYRYLWPYNLEQMKTLLDSHVITKSDVSQELRIHQGRVGPTVIDIEIRRLLNVE